nr:EOG090X00TB [Triops cancriformis]
MQKFGKGLKKKKRKEKEAQFDAAVLAEYRRRQQEAADAQSTAAVAVAEPVTTPPAHDQHSTSVGSPVETKPSPPTEAQDEDWKKFRLLTAGTDSLLNKTQEELDRIKKTSYYQRKTTGSSAGSKSQPETVVSPTSAAHWEDFGEGTRPRPREPPSFKKSESVAPELPQSAESATNGELEGPVLIPVEISDDDYENESDDDIFSTSYVDDVTAGAVKLAYVPESPTRSPLQSPIDPFDTSIAQKYVEPEPTSTVAKSAPVPATKKRNVVVKLDSAVKVLTGQTEGAKTPASEGVANNSKTKRRVTPHRSSSDAIWFDDSVEPERNGSLVSPASTAAESVENVVVDPFELNEAVTEDNVKSETLRADERAKLIAEFDLTLTNVTPDKIDLSVLSLERNTTEAASVLKDCPQKPASEEFDEFDEFVSLRTEEDPFIIPANLQQQLLGVNTVPVVPTSSDSGAPFETNLPEETPALAGQTASVTGINNDLFITKGIPPPSIAPTPVHERPDPFDTSIILNLPTPIAISSASTQGDLSLAKSGTIRDFRLPTDPFETSNVEVSTTDPFNAFAEESLPVASTGLFPVSELNTPITQQDNDPFDTSTTAFITPQTQLSTKCGEEDPFESFIAERVEDTKDPNGNPFASFEPPVSLPTTVPAFNIFEALPTQSTSSTMNIMDDAFEPPDVPVMSNGHALFQTTESVFDVQDSMMQDKTHMQNLILSVTGALQATSEDLLERLRATAPSPIPSHGHSSSPSPSVNSPASCASPEPPDTVASLESHLLNQSSFDAILNRQADLVPTLENFVLETPIMAPQAVPDHEDAEEIDLLGLPKPGSRSKASILRLYQTGSNETKDLLSDEPIEPVPLVDFNASAQQLQPEPVQIIADLGQNNKPKESEFIKAMAGISFDDGLIVNNSEAVLTNSLAESAIPPPPPPEDIVFTMEPEDDFNAFALRFESARPEDLGDAFSAVQTKESSVWGTGGSGTPGEFSSGFGTSFGNDGFLTLTEPPPPPHGTPRIRNQTFSQDSDDSQPEMAVSIKPRNEETSGVPVSNFVPLLPPPPKNPFLDCTVEEPEPAMASISSFASLVEAKRAQHAARTDSQETPTTPLFDDDQTMPLKSFLRFSPDKTWEMQLRQPTKKKITGQRFWKKIYIKLGKQGDMPTVQLYNTLEEKDPFYELPLQPCYSVSDISAQQFDQYGKIFTVKIQYMFYKERPGIRPGQVTKAERITNRLQQFAAYAIQGDYNGVKEFGSDLRKLGMPVEHAPQISQLLKLGSLNYEEMKEFISAIEEVLFRLPAPRDKTLSYRTEEVQMTAVDEFYVEQDKTGCVTEQLARVRIFLLAFLSGMPDVELGINELSRQGKEIVGRHDIIPVVTEEWIRLEDVELHQCVSKEDFEKDKIFKFKPPDACYIELTRFRIRPPKNRELPLQIRTTFNDVGQRIEIRSDILVPGYMSRKYGQIPCEDVAVRIPIPEAWIYMFRVEKHFRYGSVKAAHRRTGKIKGIERLLGMNEQFDQTLFEVTSGTAKYEHQHRAIVWRIPRLPKEGQGAYTTHAFVARINVSSFDQKPEQLPDYCYVEFTMPATNASHTTLRSLAVSQGDPPEKYVRYLARHEYKLPIARVLFKCPFRSNSECFKERRVNSDMLE